MIKFKLSHGAILPERNTQYDSGLDLRAKGFNNNWFDEYLIKEICLYPNETVLIKTGLQLELPSPIDCGQCYKVIEAQVRSRSGLALKSGIIVLNSPGTVDNSYKGDIGVILKNTSNICFTIKENDKIAQLVFVEVIVPKHLYVVEEVSETERLDKGFGSSGV